MLTFLTLLKVFDNLVGLHGAPIDLRGDDGISWGAGTVDGLSPAAEKAQIFLRVTQNSIPAGIIFDGNGYKAASIGFPLETIDNERDMQRVFTTILTYFRR